MASISPRLSANKRIEAYGTPVLYLQDISIKVVVELKSSSLRILHKMSKSLTETGQGFLFPWGKKAVGGNHL
jgi:transglutaminase/protease-like cytokinesis protein 3